MNSGSVIYCLCSLKGCLSLCFSIFASLCLSVSLSLCISVCLFCLSVSLPFPKSLIPNSFPPHAAESTWGSAWSSVKLRETTRSRSARLFQRALGQEFVGNVDPSVRKRQFPWHVASKLPFLSQASGLAGPVLLASLKSYLPSHLLALHPHWTVPINLTSVSTTPPAPFHPTSPTAQIITAALPAQFLLAMPTPCYSQNVLSNNPPSFHNHQP